MAALQSKFKFRLNENQSIPVHTDPWCQLRLEWKQHQCHHRCLELGIPDLFHCVSVPPVPYKNLRVEFKNREVTDFSLISKTSMDSNLRAPNLSGTPNHRCK